MAGWLSSATRAFRKPRPETIPQTYELQCSCGQRLSGRRSAKAQTAVCLNCGTAMFVLPASPYPPLAVPIRPRASPPKRSDGARPPAGRAVPARKASAEIDGEATDSASTAVTAQAAPVAAPDEPAGPSLRDRMKGTISKADLARWRRKVLSPVRLVLLGIAVVVVATGWWIIRSQEIDRAKEVLATVPRQAEEALAEGDVGAAAKLFGKVRAAIDLAGRDDNAARRWRQLARETAAADDLAPTSLHELLHEAIRTTSGSVPGAWTDLFRTTYRDTWVVIDAPVVRHDDDPSSPARFEVDFPMAIGEHRARLQADLPIFEQRIADAAPHRMIFAARIADCHAANDAPSDFVIELEPETAFLWGNVETFKLLGLPDDGETTKLLSEQMRVMGIEP